MSRSFARPIQTDWHLTWGENRYTEILTIWADLQNKPNLRLPGLWRIETTETNRVQSVPRVQWGPALQLPSSGAIPIRSCWASYTNCIYTSCSLGSNSPGCIFWLCAVNWQRERLSWAGTRHCDSEGCYKLLWIKERALHDTCITSWDKFIFAFTEYFSTISKSPKKEIDVHVNLRGISRYAPAYLEMPLRFTNWAVWLQLKIGRP